MDAKLLKFLPKITNLTERKCRAFEKLKLLIKSNYCKGIYIETTYLAHLKIFSVYLSCMYIIKKINKKTVFFIFVPTYLKGSYILI